jgi:hypothetical protein
MVFGIGTLRHLRGYAISPGRERLQISYLDGMQDTTGMAGARGSRWSAPRSYSAFPITVFRLTRTLTASCFSL